MKKWQKIGLTFGVLIILLALISIINQFSILYRMLAGIHPILAMVIIAILIGVVFYLVYQIAESLYRLPKGIELPDNADDETYSLYVSQTLASLKKNPFLIEFGFDWDAKADESQVEQIQAALDVLNSHSTIEMRKEASAIFLTTAVSQNGVLDSLSVFYVLMRMVWRMIVLYDRRPTLKKIITIYSHVASTILMARGIEDMDLIEAQIEPLITSIIGGSVISVIPGSVSITNLIVNSIVEGSVNALLTLRVGIVAMDYLGTLQELNPELEKRSATMRATRLMGSIIKDNGVKVIGIFVNAAKKTGIETSKKLNPFSKK